MNTSFYHLLENRLLTKATYINCRRSVVHKNNSAARLWPQRWYFYSKIREIQEDEAKKIGRMK